MKLFQNLLQSTLLRAAFSTKARGGIASSYASVLMKELNLVLRPVLPKTHFLHAAKTKSKSNRHASTESTYAPKVG